MAVAASRFADRYGLTGLLATLSSRASAPAAGSAAAAAAALAAALVAKIARGADEIGIAAQADALAARLTDLAAEDADAFEAATLALAEPRGSSGGRDHVLGTTLQRAADVPLRIAEAAADVVTLAAGLAALASPGERGDPTGAALLAAGATRAAAHLVTINLTSRPGDKRDARAKAAVQSVDRDVETLGTDAARG
ncbi:MAG TPA: cyclodeaminase/cyclohydrolase family protein [Gaiellaceae bacterium]|nr:cyclodeaminase/cyclohydrolase family protein [Gaiellaceae bacterium]